MNVSAVHAGARAGMLVLTLCAAGAASAAGLIAKDKLQHFAVSAGLGAASSAIARNHGAEPCEAARIGIGFTLVIGAGKEFYDLGHKRSDWSLGDFIWDALGATAGSLLASGCG